MELGLPFKEEYAVAGDDEWDQDKHVENQEKDPRAIAWFSWSVQNLVHRLKRIPSGVITVQLTCTREEECLTSEEPIFVLFLDLQVIFSVTRVLIIVEKINVGRFLES